MDRGKRIKAALGPIGKDFDDDVIASLFEEVGPEPDEAIVASLMEMFLPSYVDLPLSRQVSICKAVVAALRAVQSEPQSSSEGEENDGFIAPELPDDYDAIMSRVDPMTLINFTLKYPHLSPEARSYVVGFYRSDEAAISSFLKDNDAEEFHNAAKNRSEEIKHQKANQKLQDSTRQITLKYDEEFKSTGPVRLYSGKHTATKKNERVTKYVDGKPVLMRANEKYLIEKDPEPEGPQYHIRIKKKGQGGASPNFSK